MRYFKYDKVTGSFVLLREEILLTEYINILHDTDETKNKSFCWKVLLFIYLCYDKIDNPYELKFFEERFNKALSVSKLSQEDIIDELKPPYETIGEGKYARKKALSFKDRIVYNDLIQSCIDEYNFINTTITMENKDTIIESMKKQRDYIHSVDFEERDKQGAQVIDPGKIADLSDDLKKQNMIVKELDKVIDMELETVGKSRGGKSRTPIELGYFAKR